MLSFLPESWEFKSIAGRRISFVSLNPRVKQKESLSSRFGAGLVAAGHVSVCG